MGISLFKEAMPAAGRATVSAANALRHVRDSSGDLPFSALNTVQEGLAEAQDRTAAALIEGAKQKTFAEQFMAEMGGPATLAEFQAATVNIKAKVAAWNVVLEAALQSVPSADLIGLVQYGSAPMDFKLIRHKAHIPAAIADPLRADPALAELISAFEAVGAL